MSDATVQADEVPEEKVIPSVQTEPPITLEEKTVVAEKDPPKESTDWREIMAGGDEKKLARLGRFDQPGKVLDSYLELEQAYKASDGPIPFPEDGSDSDKALWREKNHVPGEAMGYLVNLPEGLAIDEEDKEGMSKLADAMYAVNAPAHVVHTAIAAYNQQVKDAIAERQTLDVKAQADSDLELNEAYGADFQRNVNDLAAWIGSAGEEVKEKILQSRTPDGNPLGSDPDFLKWMIGEMRTMKPIVTVPGLGGGDPVASLDAELAKIENTIKNDNMAYQRDSVMQSRYLTLLEAKDARK